MVLMNLFAGQQWRCRHREQTYGHGQREEGEGEMNEESSLEACTLPYVKYLVNGSLLHDSGNSKQGSVII